MMAATNPFDGLALLEDEPDSLGLEAYFAEDGELEIGELLASELAAEQAADECERTADGEPMRPGDSFAVYGMRVEKLSDVEWAVRTAGGDWSGVSQDPTGPGYLGERWAVDAVLMVEQMFDLGLATEAF